MAGRPKCVALSAGSAPRDPHGANLAAAENERVPREHAQERQPGGWIQSHRADLAAAPAHLPRVSHWKQLTAPAAASAAAATAAAAGAAAASAAAACCRHSFRHAREIQRLVKSSRVTNNCTARAYQRRCSIAHSSWLLLDLLPGMMSSLVVVSTKQDAHASSGWPLSSASQYASTSVDKMFLPAATWARSSSPSPSTARTRGPARALARITDGCRPARSGCRLRDGAHEQVNLLLRLADAARSAGALNTNGAELAERLECIAVSSVEAPEVKKRRGQPVCR